MDRTRPTRMLCLLLAGAALAASPVGAQRAAATEAEAVAALRAESERAQQRLRTAREQFERYIQELGGAPVISAGQLDSVDLLRRRLLAAQSEANRRDARLRMRAQLRQAAPTVAGRAPAGWFGVTVQTLPSAQAATSTKLVASAEYPMINSVEPGSPAFKAGLRAGDRLVMVRGIDVRRGVDLVEVLRPGTTLPVRFERDGAVREARVRIETRPVGYAPGVTVSVVEEPLPIGEQRRVVVRSLPGGSVQGVQSVQSVQSVEGVQGVSQTRAAGSAPTTNVFVFATSRTGAVAGAEVMQLDRVLAEKMGAAHGLYVLTVGPRTPAANAGILEGDVLVRAGDVALNTPVDLLRVVRQRAQSEVRTVRIELLRERKTRAVELRW